MLLLLVFGVSALVHFLHSSLLSVIFFVRLETTLFQLGVSHILHLHHQSQNIVIIEQRYCS